MPKLKNTVIRKNWPTIVTAENHGRIVYRVDGRPIAGRKFFTDRIEALAFAEELARLKGEGGAVALAMPATLRQDALEAAEILEPWGRSLAEAARHYAGHLKAEAARADAVTVEAAVADYLTVKLKEQQRGELSGATLKELRFRLSVIQGAFAGQRVADIDAKAVQKFLDTLPYAARGRLNTRTKLSQFLNHCRRRGWVAANAAELTSVRVLARDVAALTVEETNKLLRAAERSPALLPHVTIGLLAGLRPGEVVGLRWTDVHFETSQIEVRPETSKTRQRRFVPIDSRLAEWLLPHRRPSGSVTPANVVKLWRALRAEAGLSKLSGGRSWQDILRHTYATYWLALHGDRPRLAENLGNSVDVIRAFYRKAIPRAEAEKFWSLRPSLGVESKIINGQFAKVG